MEFSRDEFPDIHPDFFANTTIVTADGEVLRTGDGKSGVVIVDVSDHVPVLVVTETSDDDIINLFLTPAKSSSGVYIDDDKSVDAQVLMNRTK